jgi:[phosphatase 2A protein]-leucine-carboxy methyltransferase
VDSFLGPPGTDHKTTRQIISLGAGSDSRFFRLKHKYPDLPLIYHEFDFPTNAATKVRQMQMPSCAQNLKRLCNVDLLSDSTTSSNHDSGSQSFLFHSDRARYHLHSLDLRTLTRPKRSHSQIEEDFSRIGISLDIPTLMLSECCLIYLSPEDADLVFSYFTMAFPPATPVGVIVYEPIRPHDAFGRTMVSNLTARGIHLQTLTAHDSLAAQKERMRKHGFGGTEESNAMGAQAADIDFIWNAWIEAKEKERVENLEWMDEVEEWRLLARHYCVAWGWREASGQVTDFVFEAWAHLPLQDDDE